jgi:hypothetical protein
MFNLSAPASCAICITLALSCSMSAQSQHTHVATSNSLGALAATIDGSKTPDQIPDSTAQRLVLRALAQPPGASAEQLARQRAKLAPLLLSEGDTTLLSSILAQFLTSYQSFIKSQQTAIAAAQAAGTPFDYGDPIDQREALVASTIAAIRTQLSAPGASAFMQFVNSEKKHMTIGPFPSMPNGGQ